MAGNLARQLGCHVYTCSSNYIHVQKSILMSLYDSQDLGNCLIMPSLDCINRPFHGAGTKTRNTNPEHRNSTEQPGTPTEHPGTPPEQHGTVRNSTERLRNSTEQPGIPPE